MPEKAPSVDDQSAATKKTPLTKEQLQHIKEQMAHVQSLQEKIAGVQTQLKSHMADSLRAQAKLSNQIQSEIRESMQKHVTALVAKRQKILDSIDATTLTAKKAHILKLQGEQLEQYQQLCHLQEHISKLVIQEESKKSPPTASIQVKQEPSTLNISGPSTSSFTAPEDFVFKQPKIIPHNPQEKQKHPEDKIFFLRDNKAMFSSQARREMSPAFCTRDLPRSTYSSPRDWRFRRLEESPSPNFDNLFDAVPNLEFGQDPVFNPMIGDDFLNVMEPKSNRLNAMALT